MEYKVIRRFIDKNTNKPHEVGSKYECTEERFKEIQEKGNFLAEIKAEKPKKTAKKAE